MQEKSESGKTSNRRRFLLSTAFATGIVATANAAPENLAKKNPNRANKRDRWSNPFKRMVVFGESHTTGASATRREYSWACRLKELIDRFQHRPVELINRGLGADVLSKQAPVYQEYRGRRPIAIERYRKHVIEAEPDLVIVSYGYNDMRCGTPVDAFFADLQLVLTEIQEQTKSLLLLLDTYYIPDGGFAGRRGGTVTGSQWNRGSREKQLIFNRGLESLAVSNDLLLVRVYEALGDADWMVCDPTGRTDIHLNDLGHQIVAGRIFEVLATNCSCLAHKAQEERRRIGKSPWRSGPEGHERQLIRDFYPDSAEFTSGDGT